jgi:hypothetical protein
MIKSSESSFVGVVTRILADRIKHREEIPALYDEKADELAGLREIAHLFHSPKNARRLLTALPRSYR